MTECYTEALVLDKESSGEQDARVFLFTRDLGLIFAKITSARKATSKLNGHLEPLDLAQVRLIEKNQPQVADALKIGQLSKNFLGTLRLIKELNVAGQPDLSLWDAIKNDRLSDRLVLKLAGFDPNFAKCQTCNRTAKLNFSVPHLDYFCSFCFKIR